MIRLLMGITLSEVGGSQKVVYSIISNLPEQVYDITLVTSPGGELLDWIAELNKSRKNKIRIVTLDCIRRNLSPVYDLITFLMLTALINQGKYDIAHFHNSKMGILGRLAAKLCGTSKIYYTMHGLNLNKNTTGRIYPILSLIERVVSGFSTRVIFVSKHDMEIGIRNGWASKTNACLIYNGIPKPDISDKTDHSSRMPVIAFVARLNEPKMPEFVIRVSKKLFQAGYNHKLIIVGDGPKLESCRDLIRLFGIEQQVVLLGRCSNVTKLLSSVDIFCLFSKWEGLPISIIEAMMCGLPVVASDVGGIPELVEHGKVGYLIPGFDENLATEHLKELICDKRKREFFGEQARVVASSKFNVTGMVEQYRRLFN